jgi:hypothetical protein
LAEIAFARTGDKGDDSIIGVYCTNEANFEQAKSILTETAIAKHFGCESNQVSVTPLPKLMAFTVVIRGILAGGVTRSLRTDPHGKTLGSYLLEL